MVEINDSINSNDDKTKKKNNKSPKKSPESPSASIHIHRIYSCAELESKVNNKNINTSKLLIFVSHCYNFTAVENGG